MRLRLSTLAVTVLFAAIPATATQGSDDLLAPFQRQLDAALAQRDAAGLRKLAPFLTPQDVTALLRARPGRLRSTLRALGLAGQGTLVFLHFEEIAAGEGTAIFQSLCELRRHGDTPVAVRRVPLREAARAFRIAAHRSALRIDAETGATEMLDEIEVAVLRPTRWIFFFLDPAREVRAVSIEAGTSEVFRVANFVALERAKNWAIGERLRLEVRSRLRLTRKRAA